MSSFKLRKEKNCLNCGQEVEKKFCPACGQENIELKEDALHMVAHAIADYFHFEHKFFGTIGPLLLKPGLLTKAYVEGKRVSFIHPIRLYIFISIVFFLFVLSSGKKEKNHKAEPQKTEAHTKTEKNTSIAEQLNSLEEGLKYVPLSRAKKDSIINAARKDMESDTTKASKTELATKGKFKVGGWSPVDSTAAAYDKRQLSLPPAKRDGFIKHYFVRRTIELNEYENPQEKFVEDFLHNIPKMMFLLLPLFALILKLVYINKNRYYYEHLIYSFHVHSAIFLTILFTMLLTWLIGFVVDIEGWLIFACCIYVLWYIYRSLRTFYGSTRWVTVLKIFFLFFCYNIVLTLCFLVIIAISFVMI